ncbi:hypothetical protein ABZP36_020823 [Zizania latifolia]
MAEFDAAEPDVRSRKLESLFLDYGRVLLLGGAVIVISAVGNPASDGVQGVLGLLLVISGALLLMLSPVAHKLVPAYVPAYVPHAF